VTAEQTIKDRGVEALEIAARWPGADRATLVTLTTILAATGADAEGLSYFETLAAEQPDQVLPLVLAGGVAPAGAVPADGRAPGAGPVQVPGVRGDGRGGTGPGPVTGKTSRAALITGCSSGIGHATALRLHKTGFEVYATARRPESLADLAAAGIRTLPLDVTDEASMTAVVDQITAEQGAVAVLVNNAGYELAGPVEEIPLAEGRRQFDTNFFGLARMTQLVIPGMRACRSGRIINLSSVFGRFAVPGGAYYDASKHAVAGFTDALRLELGAFGVQVILIEPTAARTSLNANLSSAGDHDDGPYSAFRRDLAGWHARAYAGPPSNIAGRLAVSADDVAAVITRAATARRPRARYPVGTLARGLFALRRWLPGRAFDAFLRTQFPAPRPPEALPAYGAQKTPRQRPAAPRPLHRR
jgi:NAD(P)-dependent dehydrogenase (short-subunit alcohol dehydrogenase family)